jgi:outer membrane lipoprotein SlyB
MSKGNTFENDLLKLIFNADAIANICDNASSSPLTNLYLSLHTADPGEAGDQTTSEVAYTSYERKAVARSSAGFTVSTNSVVLAANQDFVAGTGGSGTASHFAVGTAASGAGKILYKGTVTPNIVCGNGVTPRLTTGTTITED